MLNKGTVYISKKYSDKIYEALDNDEEEIMKYIRIKLLNDALEERGKK